MARSPDNPVSPLAGLRVVEFRGSLAGAYTSRLFALGGADVSVIGDDDELTLHQRRYLRQGTSTGEPPTRVDWSSVDVVVESCGSGPLDPSPVPVGEHLVRVRISPYGSRGPYAERRAHELVDYAMSGHSYLYGDPRREPIPGPPGQPAIATGLYGFIGAMAALLGRDRIGLGQVVEVDHLHSMVSLHQVTLLRWLLAGDVFRRMGNRYTGAGQPNGPYRCRDGIVSIVGVSEQQVDSLLAVTGLTHLLDDPAIESSLDFYNDPDRLDGPLSDWLARHDVDEVVELFQALRIPACPLRTPLELLDDPHLEARAFWQPLGDAEGHRPAEVPGPPFRFSHEQEPAGGAWSPSRDGGDHRGPLAGLRVLDLARVWAGPLCGRILSDLGADVTCVEAPLGRGPRSIPQSMLDATRYFPDDDAGERPWNRNGHLIKYGLGKRSLAIDLQTDDGRRAFERLVPGHHVLLENFSSRVMPQLGLGEERLHALNPDLIYLTMPGYGRSGPAEHWLAYGSCIDSHAGLSALTGYADATPWKGGVAWPDALAGLHACSALLMRLWSSAVGRSGGCTIENAQLEATVAAIGDRILEAQVDAPFRPGSGVVSEGTTTDRGAASGSIVGTFRCAGPDEWIAVVIDRPDELRTALLDPAHPLGATLDVTSDTSIDDRLLSKLAVGHDAPTLATMLHSAGGIAGPVHTAPGIMADEHLQLTDTWATVDQPEVGPFTAPVTPIRFDRTPAAVRGPAPTLGQHNREVLSGAEISDAEIDALATVGVITEVPPR